MYLHRRLLPALTLALLVTTLVTTGCADDGGPVFNNEGGRELSCMQHQPEPPGSRYTDNERHNTAEVLAVLRYYTEYGNKPYCDGAPPSDADRAWAELYVQQGADRSKVAPLLDGR